MRVRSPLSLLVLLALGAAAAVAGVAISSSASSTADGIQAYEVTITPNWVHADDSASSNYNALWVYPTSPTTPYQSPNDAHEVRRYLLLDPSSTDVGGRKGNDEWWFVIERNWPADYPADNHGGWGRQVNWHNVAGDVGPAGGIGWGFGTGVSSLALDWRTGKGSPSFAIEPAQLDLDLPVPARDTWQTYVVRWVAGRTDGTTARPGAITVWANGAASPVVDRKNIDTVQKAVGPDGVTYVQKWMQIWEGDYTKDLPVKARSLFALTRVGRTLAEALADRPTMVDGTNTRQSYRGSGVNLGAPSLVRIADRDSGAAAIPASLGGAGAAAPPPAPPAAVVSTPTTPTTPTTTQPKTTTPTTTPTTTTQPKTTTQPRATGAGATATPAPGGAVAPAAFLPPTPVEVTICDATPQVAERPTLEWDGKEFADVPALRTHLRKRGVEWTRFLSGHPGVVTTLGLTPVAWDGASFYDASSLQRHLRRLRADFASWAAEHPTAVRALRANDRAVPRLDPAIRRPAATARTGCQTDAYASARTLRAAVRAQGHTWQAFLASRPDVVETFHLPAVRWDGRSFYTRRALASHLDRNGIDFSTWARQHVASLRSLPLA